MSCNGLGIPRCSLETAGKVQRKSDADWTGARSLGSRGPEFRRLDLVIKAQDSDAFGGG